MKRFFILIFLVNCIAFADVVTRISSNTYINWTKGIIVSEYSDNVDFLVGEGFDRKLLKMKSEVKKKLISELFFALSKTYFDENRFVEDIFNLFPEKRKSIVSLFDRTEMVDFRYFGGRVFSKYIVNLYGKDGVFNILRLPLIPRDYREFLNLSEPLSYTGLIISTKGFVFNISLSTKIISKSGKIIYSYGDYKGDNRYIHFFDSLDEAVSSGIFGNSILYTVPVKISGENYTDIIIDDDVIERLLSNSENHRIFFDGLVGIVVSN
ncbi:MAG: hypothetical protein ACK4F9_05650 [Brevinematia bacterium]